MALLRPYITLLPVRTPVNLNTASAMVLSASIPLLDLARRSGWSARARSRRSGRWPMQPS
jgi:general secretion pathway protein K